MYDLIEVSIKDFLASPQTPVVGGNTKFSDATKNTYFGNINIPSVSYLHLFVQKLSG